MIPIAAIQAGLSAAQAIGGLIQASKGRKELEKQIAGMPKYQESKGILDYYNQALGRYGVSPTESALYKRQMQNIQRAGAMGLAGAGGARGRMGAASSIVRQMSDASLGAEAAAEQQRAQRFGQLGQAAQLKRGEEAAAFQQNVLAPAQMRREMAAQKAAGGSQLFNVGLSNLFGAAQSAATQNLYRDIYGGESNLVKAGKGLKGIGTREGIGAMQRTQAGLGTSSAAQALPKSTPSLTRARVPYAPPKYSYSIFPTYPF